MRCSNINNAAIILVTILAFSKGVAGDSNFCASLEVVGNNAEYDRLVCEGEELMGQGRFADAAQRLEAALRIPLFEQPNFKPLPRLALAYFRSGRAKQAEMTIDEAQLALSVLADVARCVEGDAGFFIVYANGSPVTSLRRNETARRMCGAAYDGYYVRTTLQSFLRDAELIQYFFRVKEEIETAGSARDIP
ncbi:MAG: hypothetical protein AMXMBFR8_25010 [Nevskiales bacterium]